MKDLYPDNEDLAPKNTKQENSHFTKSLQETTEAINSSLNEEHKS